MLPVSLKLFSLLSALFLLQANDGQCGAINVTELEEQNTELKENITRLSDQVKDILTNLTNQLNELNNDVTELKEFVSMLHDTEIVNSSITLYQIMAPRLIKQKDELKIQQRVDGSVDFYRNWDEYVEGFGVPNTNFWLGLETIHKLSENGVKLRVDLWFTGRGYVDPNDWDNYDTKIYTNEHRYAEYNNFSIGSAATNYTLHVSGYHGTAGDSLEMNNGYPFSTKDRDNDGWGSVNCAVQRTGAWWYNKRCGLSNLNGEYGAGDWKGPHWAHFTGGSPASRVEMKIWI